MDKILLVNKPKGFTSRDVVNQLIKIFNTKKIGHFGTLDPLATGLLVVGIGKYTKAGNLFCEDTKTYQVEVLVGVKTDSYDVDGVILEENDVSSIDKDLLVGILNSFVGKYIQEVPKYSAVKVNGKKLYEYARNNEDVLLPKKEIEVFSIDLLDIFKRDGKLYFSFNCKVSKGTYVRSLINDISNKMGIFMCMSNLVRIKQDKFDIKDSYSIEQIKDGSFKFLDISDIIDLNIMEIPDDLSIKIINGSIIDFVSNKPILFIKDGKNIALYVKYDKDFNKMKPFLMF